MEAPMHPTDEKVIKTMKCKIRCVPGNAFFAKNRENFQAPRISNEEREIESWGDFSDSQDSMSLDSLRSGESSFKIFRFDPKSGIDTAKCIAFWNSVVKRNIKPIKTTLQERKLKKNKTSEAVVEVLDGQNDENAKKEETANETPDMRPLWMKYFKEIEKQKIKELKKKILCERKDIMTCYEEKQLEETEMEARRKLMSMEEKTERMQIRKQKEDAKKTANKTETTKDKMKRASLKPVMAMKKSPYKKFANKSSRPIVPKNQKGRRESIKLLWDYVEPSEKTADPRCCNCGACREDCKCEDLDDMLEKVLRETVQELVQECCACGCDQEECFCRHADDPVMCDCSCGIRGCDCQQLQKALVKECECGCGLGKECLCSDNWNMLGRGCRCGKPDCQCDKIDILGLQLQMAEEEKMKRMEARKGVRGTMRIQGPQEPQWPMEMSKNAEMGKYCLICGFFNCTCRIEVDLKPKISPLNALDNN